MSEKILIRKIWDHIINVKKVCTEEGKGIYFVKRRERKDV